MDASAVTRTAARLPRIWCSVADTWLPTALWITVLLVLVSGQREYCQFENFNATCGANQVVLMEQARYGRMHKGRCVTREFGHIGCAADVLDLIDKDCSGRSSCMVGVSGLRELVHPCPDDLVMYVEAKYSCIDVMKYSRHNRCNRTIHLLPKNNSVYISSEHVRVENRQGVSVKCPITVHALPGQQLNFTVYKFGQKGSIGQDGTRTCPPTVTFSEAGGMGRDLSECDLVYRSQKVYVSSSNSATVYFHNVDTGESDSEGHDRILLHVEATGCPNLEVPPNAWIERQGDKSIVKCNHTQEIWYVTCTGTAWTGHVTNCTPAASNVPGETQVAARKGHIPLGLVVAVTIGVILGVMFGIAMLITVFVYRRRRKSPKACKTTSLLSGSAGDEASQDNEENYSRRVWIEHKHDDPYGRICLGHNPPAQYASAATDYSHMFELQCSARAHGGIPCGDFHGESPYGQCARPAPVASLGGGGRVTADDIHTCNSMPLSAITNNSPSFATFKATERSSLAASNNERSPSRTLRANKAARQEARGGGAAANKNRSFPSVVHVEDVTSPEHQPDLVTSNNSERPAD